MFSPSLRAKNKQRKRGEIVEERQRFGNQRHFQSAAKYRNNNSAICLSSFKDMFLILERWRRQSILYPTFTFSFYYFLPFLYIHIHIFHLWHLEIIDINFNYSICHISDIHIHTEDTYWIKNKAYFSIIHHHSCI